MTFSSGLSNASNFTGLPMHSASTKPVRRGRGKGKAKGKSSAHHLANLTAAHAKGDHAAVKSHAFALIRSLPAPQPDDMDSAPPAGGAIPPTASAASPPSVSGPPMKAPSKPPGGGLSGLAGMLMSRKTR